MNLIPSRNSLCRAACTTQLVNAVHVYIGRLRRLLEPDRAHRAPGQLLASVGSGYVLRLEAGGLDVEVLAAHRDRANRLRATGDLDGAAQSFDAALGLWRGTVVRSTGPFAETERARLSDLRLTGVRGARRDPARAWPPRRARDGAPSSGR